MAALGGRAPTQGRPYRILPGGGPAGAGSAGWDSFFGSLAGGFAFADPGSAGDWGDSNFFRSSSSTVPSSAASSPGGSSSSSSDSVSSTSPASFSTASDPSPEISTSGASVSSSASS